MRVHLLLAATTAAALLTGCGKELVEFEKSGVSRAEMLQHDEGCWAQAREKVGPISEERKAKALVAATVVAGVVGAVSIAAANANADNPHSSYYVEERNKCMRAKGYGIGWAKSSAESK